ncbi:phosphatase PAP2 family protein [Sutcliffiella cohnii]|uniref:Phosphatase PAP2 family protein n=1 Tax=Sutcliffiella cohnii TaxID=33932 RepID=A0A223KR38_9BACI|nr:phosphatase PAP2 family protein [Sutcliffiella cohnii]
MSTKYNYLIILSVLSLTFFIFLANTYDSNIVEKMDIQTIKYIQGLEHPNITSVMKFFSYIGDTIRVIIISIIILFVLYKVFHQRVELILYIIVLIGSTTINVLLKNFFHRERPNFYRMLIEEGYSFPSGHSMAALSLYGIISFLLWRHIPKHSGRILLVCISAFFILIIGVSRIYLGVHFPSDIMGAYLVSGSWLTFTIWGFINVKERIITKYKAN